MPLGLPLPVQSQVTINSAKLVAPSHLQLQLDGLQPRTKYRAAVAASATILDAFGKPLKVRCEDGAPQQHLSRA